LEGIKAILVILYVGLVGTSAFASEPDVLVAVREDAPPFASYPDPNGRPAGFLWEICQRAVTRAGYRTVAIPIGTEERTLFLRNGKMRDGRTPDLLCDPTTITINRIRNFDDGNGGAQALSFSPIVFIESATYVQRRSPGKLARGRLKKGEDPQAHCNLLRSTINDIATAATPSGFKLSDLFPVNPEEPDDMEGSSFAVWGYVKGTTIGDTIRASIDRIGENAIICTFEFDSHAEAARVFCEGKMLRYFGDREIVRAALREEFRKTGVPCGVDNAVPQGATYEPYAFVLSSACRREFPERFTLALYEMFADRTIDTLFDDHFTNGKSDYLSTLFAINSIPQGFPPDPPPPQSTFTSDQSQTTDQSQDCVETPCCARIP